MLSVARDMRRARKEQDSAERIEHYRESWRGSKEAYGAEYSASSFTIKKQSQR